MRKRSELFFSLLLLPIDFVAIFGAFIAAYAIRVKVEARPVAHPLGIEFFAQVFLLIVPVWILIFALTGLYSQSNLRSRIQEIGKIFVGVSGGVMFMIVVDFISRQPVFPSKAVPIYAFGIALLAVAFGRELVRGVQRGLFRRYIGVHRTVIVGSGPVAQRLVATLKPTYRTGYDVIGALDTAKGAQQRMGKVRVDHSLANLINRIGGPFAIDEVVQADSALSPDEVLELVKYANEHHLTYRFVPNQFGLFATQSELGTVGGVPMVSMRKTPLDGWGRIVKRLFDVVLTTLGLIVLSPFFAIIALIIKTTDKGRVFYRHKRLSRSGRVIYVYKFRSMKEQYCTGGIYGDKTELEIFADMGRQDLVEEWERDQKVKEDPRISKIGGFMRRTSIDELPQLINILRGDISLVGPRPIVESELKRYGDGSSALLALKPGLTGLWQVSGRNDISYDERVKLDIFYVENWTLWLDIKILAQTVWIVLKRKGSY